MRKDTGKSILMVFPLKFMAHYLRCLELCKRLRGRFQIKIAHSARYEEFIGRSGLETFEVENFDPEEIKSAAARFDFSWINLADLERVLYSQIEVVDEYKPDAVLGDASLLLKMAAEKTGTKFISLLNGYMTKYYRLTRKISRSHPGYQYSRKMPAILFDFLTRAIEYASFRKIHEPFRRIRKELGLSPQHYLLDEFEGDVNMICDLPELFPQKRLPPNYGFVGPMFYRGAEVEREILDSIRSHHPNILVSMGSSGSSDRVAFLNDPVFEEYKIVVSGDACSTLHGPNVISKPFINHTAILPKIDVMICHSGNGTLYQALSYGVPVLCIPSNFEHEWNAQRIEESGLGAQIDDTSDVHETRRLIDFWIERKNVAPLAELRERIDVWLNTPLPPLEALLRSKGPPLLSSVSKLDSGNPSNMAALEAIE